MEPTHLALTVLIFACMYSAPIAEFLRTQPEIGLGAVGCEQRFRPHFHPNAILDLRRLKSLRSHLVGLSGSLFLEFNIPRMGRRIDAVLVVGPVCLCDPNSKSEKNALTAPRIDQVWDYALDLKNFHEASHAVSLVPILIATEAPNSPSIELRPDARQCL